MSGYKVSRVNRKDQWKLIGKQDPQLPQMFYPVANNLTLTKGDTVVRFEHIYVIRRLCLLIEIPCNLTSLFLFIRPLDARWSAIEIG